jgi:hypothetical protein
MQRLSFLNRYFLQSLMKKRALSGLLSGGRMSAWAGKNCRKTDREGEFPPIRRSLFVARRLAVAVAVAGALLLCLLYQGGTDFPVFAQDVHQSTELERTDPPEAQARRGRLPKSRPLLRVSTNHTAPVPFTKTLDISEFGLAFVNSAESNSAAGRIQRGVDTGVRMDRFPVYWEQVEKRIGEFTWTGQDAAIRANEGKSLNTLAILLGTPRQYRAGVRTVSTPLGGSFTELPAGMAPRSADCVAQEAGGECDVLEATDASGRQVRTAQDGLQVQSGACHRHEGPPAPFGLWNPIFTNGADVPPDDGRLNPTNPWARFVGAAVNRYRPGGHAGANVRHWEIWNEPDLCHFWSGTPQEFARLLKVAYIVIKWIDPEAFVVFGGLAHFENGQWLDIMLDALDADALSEQYNGFFDAAGSHHYSLSYVGYQYTRKVRSALDRRGWTDKPIWITESGVPVCNDYPGPNCPSPWRATANEQASYVWQNIAYTRLAGGGPIFHFMLHDDCGNVVAVDSPDGFGLARNESSSFCSPSNAETRLAYTAFKLANQHLTGTEVAWADIERFRVRRIAFYHPETKERRLLTWSLNSQAQTAAIPATGTSGQLIRLDGTTTTLTPVAGIYEISLNGATNANWPDGQGGYGMGIYGEPVLLIETDTIAPTASILDLPAYSPQTFDVTWHARDWGSGVKSTSVYVKVDDGDWELWKEGVDAYGKASYSGEAGKSYAFSVAAEDALGYRLEPDTALASTTVAEHSSVTGRVINPANEAAVGVQVSIGATTAATDASGRFTMTVPIGSWNISVGSQLLMRRRVFGTSESLALLYSPGTNAVTNGDFENAFSGWTKSGSSSSRIEAQTGASDHALRLASDFVANDGVPGTEGSDGGNSTVSQRVTVPAGRPFLAIAYKVDTAEPAAGADSFEVIAVEDGQPANYMLVQRQSSGWQYRSFDMAQYAGKEINLIFNVYETSPNRRTTALVDVVTLSNVPAPGPTSSAPSARPRPADVPPPPNSTTPSTQEGGASSGYRVYLPTVLNIDER